jgi:hypothetical protein
MALTPLLIEAARLKEFSVISENLDNKLLEPTIITVQDLFLKDILGKDLYAEIISQVNANTVTALNQTLLNDYVEPYLINKVISESVIDLTFKLRNKAIMTTGSDNSQIASLTDLTKVQGQYNNRAEGYRKILVDFMCESNDDYPLYCPRNRESTIGGFYLGNKRHDYRHRYENRPEKDCCD